MPPPPLSDQRSSPCGGSHRFTTAAIFTVQPPERERNPYDLRVYRARWPAIVHNCSIRSETAYGIGQRLDDASFPTDVPVSYTHLTLPTKRIV